MARRDALLDLIGYPSQDRFQINLFERAAVGIIIRAAVFVEGCAFRQEGTGPAHFIGLKLRPRIGADDRIRIVYTAKGRVPRKMFTMIKLPVRRDHHVFVAAVSAAVIRPLKWPPPRKSSYPWYFTRAV